MCSYSLHCVASLNAHREPHIGAADARWRRSPAGGSSFPTFSQLLARDIIRLLQIGSERKYNRLRLCFKAKMRPSGPAGVLLSVGFSFPPYPPDCICYRDAIGLLTLSGFVFQSKEIGIQMHEELVKVTNELYTVSTTDRPFTLRLAAARLRGVSRFRPPHVITDKGLYVS